MNVGELLRERDRLLGVIEESKSARVKLKQLNVLIAMYGEGENVDLVSTNGSGMQEVCDLCGDGFKGQRGLVIHKKLTHGVEPTSTRSGNPLTGEALSCPVCDAGPFNGVRGLNMHRQRVHGGMETPTQKAKAKAKK
jgi:hypothetical protein